MEASNDLDESTEMLVEAHFRAIPTERTYVAIWQPAGAGGSQNAARSWGLVVAHGKTSNFPLGFRLGRSSGCFSCGNGVASFFRVGHASFQSEL